MDINKQTLDIPSIRVAEADSMKNQFNGGYLEPVLRSTVIWTKLWSVLPRMVQDNVTYYDNIWTWLMQQPLLWPTWLSTGQPWLFSEISYQTNTPSMNTSLQLSLHVTHFQSKRDVNSKSFNELAPVYLYELFDGRPGRRSRSDNDNLLIVPKMNKVTFAGIAFKRAAHGISYLLSYIGGKLLTFLNLG